MEIPSKDKSLALFHINACSLNKNFNELEHLLSCANKNFGVIAVYVRNQDNKKYFSNK